jgi:hypothetical protein
MEPWFDPNQYAWIPGTVFGSTAGIMGGMVGWLVPRGKGRRFILTGWITLWASAFALGCAGMVALLNGQPWGVWYALLLPGVIGTIVMGATLLIILKSYREVEQRRLSAKDFL